MYVMVGSKKYTAISRLSFDPETDVTGGSVPINEFVVDVRTYDHIEMGSRMSLYDDLDRLWAKYWVTYSENVDKHTVQIRAQSALSVLDRIQLDPVMYSQVSAPTAISGLLQVPLGGEYSLDQSFSNAVIDGYCPKQSARVRLQWICLSMGAYLKNFFNDRLEILPLNEVADAVIPVEKTYWKPSITYKDYVTAIKATCYEYSEETPHTTDKWVEVAGRYYVQSTTEITLTNGSVPQSAPENVITLDGVTIVNSDNVDQVLTHLSRYYFKRVELDLDAVDNGEYLPGQRVTAFADEDTMMTGFINSCSFEFGLQAKASIHMTPVEVRDSATLTVTYKWGNKQIGLRKFRFPVGYAYQITNPYVTMTFNGHWYVFRPTRPTIDGTMQAGGNSVTQPEDVALDLHDGYLTIRSVDSVTLSDGTAVIA